MKLLVSRNSNLVFGIGLTLAVWILMGVLSALVKSAAQYVNAFVILFFQYVISLLFVLPFVMAKGRNFLKTEHHFLIGLRSVLGIIEYVLFFFAITAIPLIDATLLLNTAPLFIPFVILLWIKEKMNHRLWFPLIIGFVGVFCILRPGIEVFQLGSLIALIAGVSQALMMVSLRLLSSEKSLRITFYYLLLGTILLLPFPFIYWENLPVFVYVELFLVGAIFALVQYLFTKSFQYESPAYLAPFSYVFVVVAALLDWWFWGHIPSLLTWIGALLIIIGGILTIVFARRR